MTDKIEKETENKINQLQMLEQSLNNFLLQKQQFQAQLIEIDSALTELKSTEKAYKIVGNIMVASKKEDLEKDLKQKKEMVELRIKTLEKQEQKLRDKASSLQEEVMQKLKPKK
ncbi:prefoldin subunit beta [Candidatus Woesearchaeota archaeon]|nr:prefoldin subunit beta [Candidatus Woesearchaeota archaeon]